MVSAILFTIAAPCSLIVFILMITSGRNLGLVLFQLFTAGLLIFCAATNWVAYFKKYVDYKIENKLNEKKE